MVSKFIGNIFLGGTCNGSIWRDEFIRQLNNANPKITYFNPVVDDWNEKAQEEEEFQKRNGYCQLYVITPKMTGVFSIAEVVQSSCEQPENTVFLVLKKDENITFDEGMTKSLDAVKKLVKSNGAIVVDTMSDAVRRCISIVNREKKLYGDE